MKEHQHAAEAETTQETQLLRGTSSSSQVKLQVKSQVKSQVKYSVAAGLPW
jgi:hypothetical protein